MLPAPLSVGMPRGKLGRDSSPVPSSSPSRSMLNHLASDNDEPYYAGESASNHRLIPSPGDNTYAHSPVEELEPPRMSDDRYHRASPPPPHPSAAAAAIVGGGVRHGTVASSYPGETANPYRNSLPQAAQTTAFHSSDQGHGTDTTDEDFPRRQGGGGNASRAARGVSLVDHGPVVPPGSEARRVPRPSARKQSGSKPAGSGGQQPQQAQNYPQDERRSSSRQQPAGPPPGAANPLPQPGQRWNDPRYQ